MRAITVTRALTAGDGSIPTGSTTLRQRDDRGRVRDRDQAVRGGEDD